MSVYNDAAFVAASLDSLLAQSGVDFEIIAVDDGSTDGSGALLDRYAGADARVRVFHQPNRGLTQALITGCRLARGRYIARQDADDLAMDGRLRRLAALLDADPGVVLAASSTVMIGPAGELLTDIDEARTAGAAKDTSCHGSWMFRREVYERIGGYRPAFRAAQDVDLRLRFQEAGAVHVLPDVLYAYRIREGSISAASPLQKRLSRLASEAAALRARGEDDGPALAAAVALSAEPAARRRSEAGSGDYFTGRCLTALGDRRAVRYLWRACRREPMRIRHWAALGQSLATTRAARGFDVAPSGIVPRRAT